MTLATSQQQIWLPRGILMKEKTKLVAVSYLNTKPFLEGLKGGGLNKELDIEVATPSDCAAKLISGEASIGLVPVAAIPNIPNAKIISDYCIGCYGEVGTVALFSNDPIESIESIVLDYQSRTSVQLLKLLVKDYWKKEVDYIQGEAGYENNCEKGQGILVIGDRAMDLKGKYKFKFDLGDVWKKHTNLPFVFAAWVATKPLDELFVGQFNLSLSMGLSQIPKLIKQLDNRPHFSLNKYYQIYLSFDLDTQKIKALELFLGQLGYEMKEGLIRPLEIGEA